MNQKVIIAVLVLIVVAGVGYWYFTSQSTQTAPSDTSKTNEPAQTQTIETVQLQPVATQPTRQITLYHYTGEAPTEYQVTQKTIVSVPQIADATLKELFAAYLPKIKSDYIGVSLEGGIATVNFRSGADTYLQAPPGISAGYINSIRKTLLQFSTITSVQFAIDGKVITDWDA